MTLTVAERATATVERLCPAEDQQTVLEMLGLVVPARVVVVKPAPRVKAKSSRASYREGRFEHGKPSGYRMHLRHGEDACPECREAVRLYSEQRRRAAGVQPLRLRPIKHGTSYGARMHHKRREDPCDACMQAQRVYQAEYRAARRQQAIPEQQAA